MQLVTVDDVLTMMGDTSSLGEKGEVEKLVAAVARLFSPGDDDYPYLAYPTGYSGDVNKVGRRCYASDVFRSKRSFAEELLLMYVYMGEVQHPATRELLYRRRPNFDIFFCSSCSGLFQTLLVRVTLSLGSLGNFSDL